MRRRRSIRITRHHSGRHAVEMQRTGREGTVSTMFMDNIQYLQQHVLFNLVIAYPLSGLVKV